METILCSLQIEQNNPVTFFYVYWARERIQSKKIKRQWLNRRVGLRLVSGNALKAVNFFTLDK